MRKYTETALIYFSPAYLAGRYRIQYAVYSHQNYICPCFVGQFLRKDMIAGFTFHSMLSYYIISSFYPR